MGDLISIFMSVVKENYANFNGRARRREYWMFFLGYMIIYAILYALMIILAAIDPSLALIGSILLLIFALGLFLPTLAVGVRRLHDTNKSGWFMLLGLVPLANLYLLYLFITEGDKGSNQYGEDPKAD